VTRAVARVEDGDLGAKSTTAGAVACDHSDQGRKGRLRAGWHLQQPPDALPLAGSPAEVETGRCRDRSFETVNTTGQKHHCGRCGL